MKCQIYFFLNFIKKIRMRSRKNGLLYPENDFKHKLKFIAMEIIGTNSI